MATFSGGETIKEVKEIDVVVSSSGGIGYTVPSGRYAIVNVLFIDDVANPFEWRNSSGVLISPFDTTITNPVDTYEILMTQNQEIRNGGGSNKRLVLNIREFNNPS